MRIFRLFLFALCALLLSTFSVKAQSIKDADNAFQNKQYEHALEDYKKGIKKISKNQIEVRRVTFQIAECYRIMGDLKRAEQQYIRLEKKNYQKDNPMILFHLGSIYNLRGEYDQALRYFEDYKKRAPKDTRISSRIEGCKMSIVWVETPTRYEVENFKKLNTKQDEWAPRWGNMEKYNQILLSSNRDGSIGKGTDQWTGGSFSDIYRTDKPRSRNTEWPGEWSPVLPIDEGEVVNTAVNEGEASANLKGGVIYFTKCPHDKKRVMGCYVYQSTKRGRSWSEPEMVELGPDTFNYVHPFISPDELTLYFSSNKSGGYGGYDIYKATRAKKNEKFSSIVNLGANVNTAGQEVFPTMRGDSMLYFSSDGHIGMGGLDIFQSEFKKGIFHPAQNMMFPINSSWDDMSIIFDETEAIDPLSKSAYMEKGFFSSNRPGGRGGDDIYYFVLRPLAFTLSGFIRDEATLQYIDGADVEIIGSDGTSYKTKTNVKGQYNFDKNKILGNVTYNIRVTKAKYWEENNTASQTTVGLSENTDLKQDFVLTPIPKEPIILPEILYDLAKWDLKTQYKDSLLFLYNIMIKNPTLVVELRSHTDYRGSNEDNEVLSQKRAQSAVDFLVREKGIDPERIVPKGYGEYRPRRFNSNINFNYQGKLYTFPRGTELTEEYITSLTDKNMQEAANALNRRTEFVVLRDDFVPKDDSIGSATRPVIAVVQDRAIPITFHNKVMKGVCVVNNKNFGFEVTKEAEVTVAISYTIASQLLRERNIEIGDFEEKENAIKQEDGSIIENSVLILKELRLGEESATDVRVVVMRGLASDIVINENFIKETWGEYRVEQDKNRIIFEK